MTQHQLHINGMPYAPGIIQGRVQRQLNNILPNTILLISQHDISVVNGFPAGFIVVEGAPLSHTMISLLGTGRPTVNINSQQASLLEVGMEIVVNGMTGLITTDLTEAESIAPLPQLTDTNGAIVTVGGVAVSLRASVRNVSAARKALATGVASIGLVRSEFLLPDDERLPDVAFYRQAFGELCQAVKPLPVTIRLLDVAPDKMPPGMLSIDATGGALGMQGVRLFGLEPVRSLVQAQLLAIDELNEHYDLRLLIPYLVRREELQYWVEYIRKQVSNPISIGAMIETPAGALDFVNWLDIVDFVAIGTNDLMQCLFAADRDRPEMRNYLDPYAPLLFRFLQQMALMAEAHVEKIQLCGVLSQLPGVLPVLLGLGYRVFSVDVALVPHIKQVIMTTNITEAKALAAKVCAALETKQVLELLQLHSSSAQPFFQPK